jgi:hypothetical protein
MRTSSRILGMVAVLLLSILAAGSARADQVTSIRMTDRGNFQVWNGVDGENAASGARVLAVIGPRKSLRVNYNASMAPPQVSVGRGFVDIVAAPGMGLSYSGRDTDCHSDLILYCTNRPIRGAPAGSIVCMCVRQWGSICCSADTGIYGDIVPRDGGEY